MEPAINPAARLSSLSQHEIQALRLAGEGKSTDQIAYLLSRNPADVLRDRAVVYDKLGLTALTPQARLQQLTRLHDGQDLAALGDGLPGDGVVRTLEPSAAALAAVAADDRLLGQGGIPAPPPVLTEQRTTRLERAPLEPAPLAPAPRPFLPVWFTGNPGMMLAALAVALIVGALIVWLILAASRPAPAPQPAIVATVVTPAPAQNVAPPPPAPPPPPSTPAPTGGVASGAAAPPAPSGAAPSAPPAPPPAAAPVPAQVAPAAPAPSSAPVSIAPAAPATGGAAGSATGPAPAAGNLPSLAPLAVSTPFAMPPANTTTPPNSVLTLGQTWSVNGLNLTLVNAQASSGGIAMNFVLSNGRSTPVTVQMTRGQIFSAVDNAGTALTVTDPNFVYDVTLPPNSAIVFDAAHNGGPIVFSGNLGSSGVTSVTVTVNGLSSISNARWRIALSH